MSRINEDDYFQDSTMSFGEHLEELRNCLIRAIAGLVVGFVIGLFIGGQVVEMVQSPLKRALTSYYQGRSERTIIDHQNEFYQRGYGEDIMTLPTQYDIVAEKYYFNLDELAKALGIDVKDLPIDLTNPCNELCSDKNGGLTSEEVLEKSKQWRVADYFNIEKWAQWCSESWKKKGIDVTEDVSTTVQEQVVAETKNETKNETETKTEVVAEQGTPANAENPQAPVKAERRNTRLVSLYLWKPSAEDERTQVKNFAVQETFMIYIKAALMAGVIISSPWIFWQIWSFIAAGLYPHEKRYVHIFLPFSLGLFLAGNMLAFFFVFEPVLQYLFSFNEWMGIAPDPRISEWLGFFLFLPIGFGISFQLPLVMLFLDRIGICSVELYLKYWRVAIFVIFVLSMLLTPADPTSMVLMAIPLTALYIGGALLCKFMPRKNNPYAVTKS